VDELDEIWAEMFQRSSGALDELIALKATNDEIRTKGVEWLLNAFTELGGEANRRQIAIEVQREDPHNFSAYGANMVGSKTSFRYGLRSMTIEAGWTRGPADGFMRGGALAIANINHFGLKQHSATLALLKTEKLPEWHEIDRDNVARPIRFEDLARHFAILIDRK
jgi:hypothetical protein